MKITRLITLLALIIGLFCLPNQSLSAVLWGSTSPLPSAYVGVPYSYQLQATSSTFSPISYLVTAGSLPGLSVSPTGLISGTVTAPGSANVSIQASDGDLSSGPVSRAFSITYLSSTGITGPLRIKRLQIYFDNNRPETTVLKNQKSPQAFADISYVGSGVLKGYWIVDGVNHSQIHRTLTAGANLTLPLPMAPPLPTYQTGTHRVQLLITEPTIGTVPEISYFVTENKNEVFEPIRIIAPSDRLEVDYTPLTFKWYMQKNSAAYLIEFRQKEDDEKPLFAAYTGRETYTLPAHSLNQYFSAKGKYFWKVKGIADDDSIVNESEMHHFIFK